MFLNRDALCISAMKTPKCENCGTDMLEFFNKTGLKAFICGSRASGGVRSLKGRLRYIEIPCHMEIDGPRATFERKSTESVETLRAATLYTIPSGQLLGNANAGILAEIPPERIPKLFADATALGLVLAKSPLQSIETLVYGIRNKSPRRLDNIGVNMFRKDKIAQEAYPDEEPDVAWKIYACDMVEDLANKISGDD